MKKKSRKLRYFLAQFWYAAVAGNISGFLLGAVGVRAFDMAFGPLYLLAGVATFLGVIGTLLVKGRKQIRESNIRMKDMEYLKSLEAQGLVRLKKKSEIYGAP